jgi:hypothetical protein
MGTSIVRRKGGGTSMDLSRRRHHQDTQLANSDVNMWVDVLGKEHWK